MCAHGREIGRGAEDAVRRPTGPAKVLLRIVVRKPEIFTEMQREDARELAMA